MNYTIFFVTILISLTLLGLLALCFRRQFGLKSTKRHLTKISRSVNFNQRLGKFVNDQAYALKLPSSNYARKEFIQQYFFSKKIKRPRHKLPEIKPDLSEFLRPAAHIKFIWFGHSSFMVNINGKILLVDPVFSNQASPISNFIRRFQKPVLALKQLPPIDYIVLSHDHYDHLDMQSMLFFKNTDAKFLVPLGVSSHLQSWGISTQRINELDWWQSIQLDSLEFIFTPAQHFSGRRFAYGNQTLWGSWVVRSAQHSFYFSGDSGYAKHFKAIGDKYGPFDLAFLENGQYNIMWRSVHMFPEDVVQAVADLQAKVLMPVHWGMFDLSVHNWYDPIESIYNLAKENQIQLVTPKLGQIVDMSQNINFETWWKACLSD